MTYHCRSSRFKNLMLIWDGDGTYYEKLLNHIGYLKMIVSTVVAKNDYFRSKPDATRKQLGQYFTSSTVASYMAAMIGATSAPVTRILDAGAGTGILVMTAVQRCLELGNNHIHAVLYEIDNEAIVHLESNMKMLVESLKKQKGKFTFEIRNEDFVLARPDKFEEPFHLASINPPYFKYNSKTSPYADATADLFKGNPNIYASFMAIVAKCMAKNGQMIAIVPRSFTNGLYFKSFRQYLNRLMSLERIHVFRARNQVFKESSVLQENVICYYSKRPQAKKIEIYTSAGCEDLQYSIHNNYSSNLLIDSSNDHQIIRIPETLEDAQILKMVESWPTTFENNKYFISTGPIVEHRTKKYIVSSEKNNESVPLLRMHNIKAFKTEWTGQNKKDARFLLIDEYKKHISQNQVYIILKRFSSKDEKRRLVAGIHNPELIKTKFIGLENHLNYIGRVDRSLDLSEAYGLAALFNSTFMDRYFRSISGNTQVNATEIRLLKLPKREIILQIGKKFLMNKEVIDQHRIDRVVNTFIKMWN